MSRRAKVPQFEAHHENMAREIYRDACRNGEGVLRAAGGPEKAFADPAVRRLFYEQANRGFARAQDRIVARLVELESISGSIEGQFLSEELLLRKLADSMMWQLFGNQLYVARRLCRDEAPPRLTSSNYLSVLATSRSMMEPNYSTAAIMADITTFVQIADLAVLDSELGQLSFAEVKEGEKNHRYLEALEVMGKNPSPEFIRRFQDQEGKHGLAQLKRMAKQAMRMEQVAEILNTGSGIDPIFDRPIHIPDKPFAIEDWDSQLREVVEESKKKGWAISVVDGALFVGAYRGKMASVGQHIFKAWFDLECKEKPFPWLNLMQCMETPLALPLFSRLTLTEDMIFDLLFGRCRVYVGINLDALIALIARYGVTVRWASRKESARHAKDSLQIDHRSIFCKKGDHEVVLGDGHLVRMAFHGISPDSAAKMISSFGDMDFGPVEEVTA